MTDRIFGSILITYFKETKEDTIIKDILSTDKRIYNDLLFTINKYSKSIFTTGKKIKEKIPMFSIYQDHDLVFPHKINTVYYDKKWIHYWHEKGVNKQLPSHIEIEQNYENIIKENFDIDMKDILRITIYEYRSQFELTLEQMMENIEKQYYNDDEKYKNYSSNEYILMYGLLKCIRNIDIGFW